MIDLYREDNIFRDNVCSLKDTSLDSSRKESMTNSDIEAINFDNVVRDYSSRMHVEVRPSVDAIFCDDNDCLVFVEFKNGVIKKADKHAICGKLLESVIVFIDLTSSSVSDLRENVTCILVYNEQNNRDSAMVQEDKPPAEIAEVFVDLTELIRKRTPEASVKFGLRKFQRYCFSKVYTFTEAEFEDYLKKNCKKNHSIRHLLDL